MEMNAKTELKCNECHSSPTCCGNEPKTQKCHISDTLNYIIIQENDTKTLTRIILYGTLVARIERISHEKANPVKAGDAKLKGLITLTESEVDGSQLPNRYSAVF